MSVAKLAPPDNLPLPFEYSIAMGVRKGDTALRDRLDALLVRRKKDIDAILDSYFVPRVALAAPDTPALGAQP
jgi:mxaJ protein